MSRFIALALLVLALLSGCAAKQPVPGMEEHPLFNVKVEPVTVPQLYRYGPSIGQAEVKTVSEVNDQKTSMAMTLKYSNIEDGDILHWHIFVPEWTDNGKHYRPSVPLLDVAMDTDLRGVVEKTDVTFPIIRAYNITDPKALKEFEVIGEAMTNMSVELPLDPIISGQPIQKADTSQLERIISSISQTPYHRLDGEFTHNGVRYVATSLKETISGKLKADGQTIYITFDTRNIFTKENMEEIFGFGTIVGKNSSGEEIFTTKLIYAKTQEDLSH